VYENVHIKDAYNRVVAKDIEAEIDIPPFRRSAMDGYAVIAKSTFGATQYAPKVLKKIGSVQAGEVCKKIIKNDECIQIATGAQMPASADAVIIAEDTEINGNTVKIYKSVAPGENVSQKGVDIKKGDRIVNADDLLCASKIGLLASAGIQNIDVYKQPSVSIISTGDEIVEVGRTLPEGKVYDSNIYTISAIVAENGGIPIEEGIVPDTAQNIEDKLKECISKSDLIVVSGGSSVGTKDILVDIVTKIGKLLFHGVLIKPGKPLLCAQVSGKLLFGIPGYPMSCFMVTYIFVAPVVRKLAHLPRRKQTVVSMKLASNYHKKSGRREFLPVKVVQKLNEQYAVPVYKETGALTSVSNADGYIEIEEDTELVEKDEYVDVKLF
jgi:molybdenum cofactor synthesis domain-containing protein